MSSREAASQTAKTWKRANSASGFPSQRFLLPKMFEETYSLLSSQLLYLKSKTCDAQARVETELLGPLLSLAP